MKQMFRLFTIPLLMLVLFTSMLSNVKAASGYQGNAIYRDGVLLGLEWHAGLMDEPFSTDPLPVTHHSGKGYVKWDKFDNFLDGNNFKGVYKPKQSTTSDDRDMFVALGRKLITEDIPYSLIFQVDYDLSDEDQGPWVNLSEITGMRCDGVVEYIYEWYGFRVYGNDDYWDVTRFGFYNKDYHSGIAITPKKQPDYLTLVTPNKP